MTTTNGERVARAIQAVLDQRSPEGWTTGAWFKKAGLAKGTFRNFVTRGARSMNTSTLERLAKAVDMTPEQLLSMGDNNFPDMEEGQRPGLGDDEVQNARMVLQAVQNLTAAIDRFTEAAQRRDEAMASRIESLHAEIRRSAASEVRKLTRKAANGQ